MSTGYKGPLVYSNPGHLLNGIPIDLAHQCHTIFGSGDRVSGYANDFHLWEGPLATGTAGGWTATDNAGSCVIGLQDAVNGILALTTGGTEDNDANLKLNGETFKYISGKRLWFAARVAVTDANDMEAAIGLGQPVTDFVGTPPTDSLYFRKTETGTDFTFVVEKGSTETTVACGLTLTDSGYVVLGFVVDASGNIFWYAEDDATAGSAGLTTATNIAATNAPDDEELHLFLGAETGGGSANSLLVDWIAVAQER